MKLPHLGLGLSTNLDAYAQPNPYRVHARDPKLFDFVEYSAPLDLEQARTEASLFEELWSAREKLPALFHPVHLNLYGPTLESTENLRLLDAQARAVGSPWVGNDVGWWHEEGTPLPGYLYLSPPLDARGLEDCVAHAEHVQAHLSLPLLLENPVITVRRGDLHVLDFMAKLHARTGLGLILDLGHLLSHQLTHELPLTSGLDGFPFDAVAEVHLAGGVITRRGQRRVYFDDHTQPIREEVFQLLEAIAPRCRNLSALTYEGDGHPEELAIATLRRLRKLIPPRTAPVAETKPRERNTRPHELRGESKPWQLFDEAHDRAEPTADPEGVAADRELRLAVLAEKLDAAFPLSRSLAAGTSESLLRFSASDDYRRVFAGEGRGLVAAFSSWARGEFRSRADDALATALSFELWAHRAAHTHPREAPAPGQMVLAPGWSVSAFPFDLSESFFAARALKRHLLSRAWATGALPDDGLQGLAQTLRRPAPGPWNLALRFVGDALSVIPLSASAASVLSSAARPVPLRDTEDVRSLLAQGLLRSG